MKSNHTSCKAVHEIWLEEATGRPLTSSERALVDEHLAQCRECRLETEATAAVEFDGTPGPAPKLDELGHRRWVDEVLSRAESAPPKSDAQSDERETRGATIYRIGFFAAAAAVVALITGGVIWLSLGDTPTSEPVAPVAAETEVTPLEGQLLLAAGDVRLGGTPVAGMVRVEAGRTASVGQGRAVIDLGTGITLLAESDTEIEVAALDSNAIEVRLERGRVVAEVDPARSGPPFAIATRDGRILVTGTAFSVEVGNDQVEVQVFRGSVRVEEEKVQSRKVRLGEAAVLGRAGVVQLDDEDEAAASEVLRAFDMLSAEGATRMEVQSLPTGATVVVDGVALGQTPLEVSIRPGHRSLELSLDGYETVRELLELVPDSPASRVFDLVGTETPVNAEVAAVSAAEATPVKRPKEVAPPESAPLGPAELLDRARAFRVARDWRNAVAAYQELLSQYPGSAQARNSLVSLGDIQL
ncbi:MAG: FecR domain-containing protein, partial [Deltaproteobacteria bacterium]|nr:FecR domain-containing protein [Deltaproteobacteria bacterium]